MWGCACVIRLVRSSPGICLLELCKWKSYRAHRIVDCFGRHTLLPGFPVQWRGHFPFDPSLCLSQEVAALGGHKDPLLDRRAFLPLPPGPTPLRFSSFQGHAACCRFLLEHRADVNHVARWIAETGPFRHLVILDGGQRLSRLQPCWATRKW